MLADYERVGLEESDSEREMVLAEINLEEVVWVAAEKVADTRG